MAFLFLNQMTLQWLENMLVTNPNVATFPALSAFRDAVSSGATIANPALNTTANNATGLQGGTYSATIPVVTRAQIQAAYQAAVDNSKTLQGVVIPVVPIQTPAPAPAVSGLSSVAGLATVMPTQIIQTGVLNTGPNMNAYVPIVTANSQVQ